MAEFRVLLSDEAGKNIDEIGAWTASKSHGGVVRWYSALGKAIESLARDPHRFPKPWRVT